MFFHTLTEATFHKGLGILLNSSMSNPEGIVELEHLFKAFQQAIDEEPTFPADYNIQKLSESWRVNAGYPIVKVERSYNDRRIKFTQVRQIQFSPSQLDLMISLRIFCVLESLRRLNIE